MEKSQAQIPERPPKNILELVEINELADILRLPAKQLRKAAEKGLIPSRKSGHRYFFDPDVVDASPWTSELRRRNR